MSQTNYATMTDEQLKRYLLDHRDDREAFHAYLDRRHTQNRPVIAHIDDPDFDAKLQAAVKAQMQQPETSKVQMNFHGPVYGAVGRNEGDMIINASNQNLATAATDIKQLLDRLSQEYPSNTPAGQAIIGAKAIEQIENNPTLKKRVINALKEAGATALEEAIDHPAIKIVVAGAKGFIDV
jgi:hypothetical protein